MHDEVMDQRSAWRAYHTWLEDERVEFHVEPEAPEFERLFEALTRKPLPSTKLWADAYLAAFAWVAGLTLVSFDRALFALAPGSTLLDGTN